MSNKLKALPALVLSALALPAFAAAPAVDDFEVTIDSDASDGSHDINIPGNACTSSQALAVGVFTSNVGNTITPAATYTSKTSRANNSESGEMFYHKCTGAEGATVTFTFSTNTTMIALVWKVSAFDSANDMEATSTGGAATTTPDPPNITPSGGSKTYLILAVTVQDDTGAFTSCSTNYTANCGSATVGSSTSDGIRVGYSYRALTSAAASEDPGAFTYAASDTYDAYTAAIFPATAAAPTFTAGPTAGTFTQTTMPFTFTLSATGTVYGVACPNGQTATVAQTKAGNCSGGAAVSSWSEAVVGGVSDGHTFTGLVAGTTYDPYFAGNDGSLDTSSATNVADQTTVAAPTFTSGPSTGTLTSTTAQINATTSQTGTWYGIACTNGQTATVAQVIAGTTCSGGASIASFSEAVVAGVADTHTFTGLSASTTYSTFHAQSNAAGNSASASSLSVTTQAAATASFSSGPSVAAAANGYTISGTIDQNATVYAVAYSPGNTVPTCTQVKAGQNQLGVAAILSANEAWTATAPDSFSLAAANKPVRLDVAVCANNANGDTLVTEFTNQNRSARAGKSIVVLDNKDPSGICGLDAHFEEDCAVGDVFEYDSATVEAPNCYATIDTGGDIQLLDHTDGDVSDGLDASDAGDDSVDDCGLDTVIRRSVALDYENVSSTTTATFPTPATGNFVTSETNYINNTAPVFVAVDSDIVIERNTNFGAEQFDPAATHWNDPDAETPTISYQDSLPTGISYSAPYLVGTATVCGISTVTERATDITGEYTEQDIQIGVGDVIPDVSGMTATAAAAILEALCQ